MPGREHRDMPDDARSIRQPQLHAGGSGRDQDAFFLNETESGPFTLGDFHEKLLEVEAIDAARRIDWGVFLLRQSFVLQPAPEMLRVVRKRTHAHRAYIEQVIRQQR